MMRAASISNQILGCSPTMPARACTSLSSSKQITENAEVTLG
jgi:hypothetical protein